jgi:hypothetical protein
MEQGRAHAGLSAVVSTVVIAMAIAGCTDSGDKGMQQGPQQIAGTGGAGGSVAGTGGAGGSVAGVGGVGGAVAGSGGAAGTMITGGEGGSAGALAGTGGVAGTMPAGGEGGGTAGTDMPPDAGVVIPEPMDLGMGDGQDVVTIGDSWMSYFLNGGGIEGALDRADTNYRHYGVAGTTLGSSIPPQWDSALRAGEVKTVIMTGGGNDIMFSGGCDTKEACEMSVQRIADMLHELWSKMSEAGVQDVVYIQYSKNAGTAPSENRPATSPTPGICITGPIRCHTVPTTEEVGAGDTVDGIHPTSAACDRIATSVLEYMEMKGIRR